MNEHTDSWSKWEAVNAAFGTTSHIVYSLPKCLQCGAVVDSPDREKHYDWHALTNTRGAS